MVTLVLKQALRLLAGGLIVGTALAWSSSRVLGAFLFEVSAHNAAVFVGVPLGLLLVGLVAAYVPARRAAASDPLVALRNE